MNQQQSTTQADQLRFVEQLEHSVWQAVLAKDGEMLARLFSNDYLEITLEGKRVRKGQIVEESPQTDDITGYLIEETSVIELSKRTLLLNYRVTIDGTFLGELISPRKRWATSVWREHDSHWKCCFFQQSPYGEVQSGQASLVPQRPS